MAKPKPSVSYADLEDEIEMVRFYFRAYRQARGWNVTAVEAKLGSPGFVSRFEKPGGLKRLDVVWRAVHELGVDPVFLFTGDMDGLKPHIARRVKAILDVGRTVQDDEVAATLEAAGLDPLG